VRWEWKDVLEGHLDLLGEGSGNVLTQQLEIGALRLLPGAAQFTGPAGEPGVDHDLGAPAEARDPFADPVYLARRVGPQYVRELDGESE